MTMDQNGSKSNDYESKYGDDESNDDVSKSNDYESKYGNDESNDYGQPKDHFRYF